MNRAECRETHLQASLASHQAAAWHRRYAAYPGGYAQAHTTTRPADGPEGGRRFLHKCVVTSRESPPILVA